MGLKNLAIIYCLILVSVFVSAETCSIQSSCNSDYTIMKLSGTTNAHGSLYNQGSYTNYLCCDFTGTHTCSGTNKIIGLSAVTNAHGEIPSLTNYGTHVCFGNLKCVSGSGSCPTGYNVLMLSLSSSTNAHLGSFNTYPTKICCCAPSAWEWTNNYQCVGDIRQRQQIRSVCPSTSYEYQWVDYSCPSGQRCIGSGQCVDSCIFTSAYWSQSSVGEETNAEMIVAGNSYCTGDSITFKIYEDDLIGDDLIATISSIFDRGTWTAEWIDDGFGQGDPEYYFIATLNAYIAVTKQSGLLSVTAVCGNGVISGDEECDDGANNDGDGCSSSCTIELGWLCTGEPSLCSAICGDSLIVGGEVCDDGANNGLYSYCNADCTGIGEYCGDGIINGPEECDDGGAEDGDGCSDICELETEAYWADRYGNRIGNNIEISANVGSTIKMILNNSGLGMEEFVTFEIYEDDLINDEEIRTINKGNEIYGIFENIGYGIITIEWTITQEDYDAANELFADYDGFVFRINEHQSNELTIWLEDETFWCSDYDNEDICERCNDYNCYAAKNSVDKKVFEAFPDVWGDLRCGSEIAVSPECNYVLECWCSWNSSATPSCGYEWELISYNCVNYPAIGFCSYQENVTDDCDDGLLKYSWIATWTWGIDNGYDNYNDGPSNNESDYIFANGKYYYDPEKISERCSEATNIIPCPAQVQLSFFTLQSFLASLIILAAIYFAWNLKNKKLKIKKIKQIKKKK